MRPAISSRPTKLKARIMADGRPAYVIATLAGFSPSRMSEYALGSEPIPPVRVIALCEVLSCNPEDILGLEDPWD